LQNQQITKLPAIKTCPKASHFDHWKSIKKRRWDKKAYSLSSLVTKFIA
jgi:hypothetical protein